MRSDTPQPIVNIIVEDVVNQSLNVLWCGLIKMCNACWESYYAGYLTKSEVWQCIYYLDIIRNQRDTHRRVPKRDPDDPYFCLELGEGLLPYMFDRIGDMKDWYYLVYRSTRRRKIYRYNAAGEGAGSPEERVPRGVEDETNGWPKLHDY